MSPVEKETQDFLFDNLVSLQHHKKCLPSVVFCISFQTSLFLSSLFFFLFPWLKKKLSSFLFSIPLMILPHSCLKYVEKNHPLLKVVLYSGFIHWHNYVFCDTSYFLSNPTCCFIIFFPCHWSDVLKECFANTTWRGCCSLWKCLGSCFCIVFNAVTLVCLKEQHGICTVDLATSSTLSTGRISCGLPSIKNRITKEKYSTPEPLIFSDALQ